MCGTAPNGLQENRLRPCWINNNKNKYLNSDQLFVKGANFIKFFRGNEYRRSHSENHFTRKSSRRILIGMALNKIEICGVNTAKLPLLSNDERIQLFARIQEGDMEARELYIKRESQACTEVIKKFSSSNENADDLFQIGCIGLIKAIDNF